MLDHTATKGEQRPLEAARDDGRKRIVPHPDRDPGTGTTPKRRRCHVPTQRRPQGQPPKSPCQASGGTAPTSSQRNQDRTNSLNQAPECFKSTMRSAAIPTGSPRIARHPDAPFGPVLEPSTRGFGRRLTCQGRTSATLAMEDLASVSGHLERDTQLARRSGPEATSSRLPASIEQLGSIRPAFRSSDRANAAGRQHWGAMSPPLHPSATGWSLTERLTDPAICVHVKRPRSAVISSPSSS